VSWEGDFYGANTYTNLLHKYVLVPEWQRVDNPHLHRQIKVCNIYFQLLNALILLAREGTGSGLLLINTWLICMTENVIE